MDCLGLVYPPPNSSKLLRASHQLHWWRHSMRHVPGWQLNSNQTQKINNNLQFSRPPWYFYICIYLYVVYFLWRINQKAFFFETCFHHLWGRLTSKRTTSNPPRPWNTSTVPASTKLPTLRRDSMLMSPHSWSMGCVHASNSPAFKIKKKNDVFSMHSFLIHVKRNMIFLVQILFSFDVLLIFLCLSSRNAHVCPALTNLHRRSWKETQNAEWP